MADSSILIKDASGLNRELAADLTGSVYTPKNLVTGPLTDAELRASPVFVSGPLTDDLLRATPVPVSGPVTNAELRATALPVSGPLRDSELRATPVPVSGPLTDSQMRANPVTVTEKNAAAAPISSGVYTVAANTLLSAITVPVGATGVRLFAVTKNVLFLTDAAPAVPSANSLTAGGLAIAGQLRVYRFPSAPANLQLRSTEAGGGASTDIAIEFFGA